VTHGRQLGRFNRRFWTILSLVTLLLAVVAISSSHNSEAAGRELAVQVAPPEDHKVIFIQGINSESGNDTCKDVGFIEDGRNRVQWMVDYLVGTPWVTDSAPSLDSREDFFYFSYSGDYCTKNDGSFNFQKPRYSDGDTCDGVRNAARRLHDMVEQLLVDHPDAKFTFISHSMGGMVASGLVRLHPDMVDRVNSVITFDSPLRGIPNSILVERGQDVEFICIPFFSQSWDDLECDDYTRIPGACDSEVVPGIAEVGHSVPYFTMDAVRNDLPLIEYVPGDRTTLLSSDSRLHCQFGDNHETIWNRGQTDGGPVTCWLTFTYPSDILDGDPGPPDFQLARSPEDIKTIFVACALTMDVEACKSQLTSDAPPTVSITSPADGSVFNSGGTIDFTGTANDAEDGDISASIVWTSNLHPGVLATGASLATNLLIDGVHTITAPITDSLGGTTSGSITITVGP